MTRNFDNPHSVSRASPRRRVSFVVAATFAVLASEACVALSAWLFI